MRHRRNDLLFALLMLVSCGSDSRGDETATQPGFMPLFNGQDLSGWKLKRGGEALEGKVEAAGGRFRVAERQLILDPTIKGDVTIETNGELGGDLRLTFEFLPGAGCNNDLFLRGMKFDLKAADVKNLKQDEWNQFEIAIAGSQAEFKCNGEGLKKMPVKQASSPLGVRAEFGPIRFRNVQVKKLP